MRRAVGAYHRRRALLLVPRTEHLSMYRPLRQMSVQPPSATSRVDDPLQDSLEGAIARSSLPLAACSLRRRCINRQSRRSELWVRGCRQSIPTTTHNDVQRRLAASSYGSFTHHPESHPSRQKRVAGDCGANARSEQTSGSAHVV